MNYLYAYEPIKAFRPKNRRQPCLLNKSCRKCGSSPFVRPFLEIEPEYNLAGSTFLLCVEFIRREVVEADSACLF